jgi:hypothetical protein
VVPNEQGIWRGHNVHGTPPNALDPAGLDVLYYDVDDSVAKLCPGEKGEAWTPMTTLPDSTPESDDVREDQTGWAFPAVNFYHQFGKIIYGWEKIHDKEFECEKDVVVDKTIPVTRYSGERTERNREGI